MPSQVDHLVDATKLVMEHLVQQPNERLDKEQIEGLLGAEWVGYYSYVVDALASVGKITRQENGVGGIELRHAKGLKPTLTKGNLGKIQKIFKEALGPTPGPAPSMNESRLYQPLKEFLEGTGLFDIVENCAQLRGGAKWENVDLFCIKYTKKLRFHPTIDVRTSAIEVKSEGIKIEYVQQAASYLRSANAAYLCFYDQAYTGKDLNGLLQRLRNEGSWRWASTYGVGLIVGYLPTWKSKRPQFQIIREAPFSVVHPLDIERAIENCVSAANQEVLASDMKAHIKELL